MAMRHGAFSSVACGTTASSARSAGHARTRPGPLPSQPPLIGRRRFLATLAGLAGMLVRASDPASAQAIAEADPPISPFAGSPPPVSNAPAAVPAMAFGGREAAPDDLRIAAASTT